jgi:hypothetical protein
MFALLHALSSTGKLYSDRYFHMRALIIHIVAPASTGQESFHAPSNRGSAFQGLVSNLIGSRDLCRLHSSPLLEALGVENFCPPIPTERKPIFLHGTNAIPIRTPSEAPR